ncbi:MAG: hypothetical protein J6C46_12730 [Clostridia bacterium]|nr:hypothetical protein [Clostridia bacterium]
MIKYILLLLIFISCFQIVSKIFLRVQFNKYKNKSNSLFHTKEIQFKNFISKINFIKTKEIFLSKQGYPFKLDVIRYYFLKIILALLFFVVGIINYNSILYAVVLSFCIYFLIDLIILMNKKTRDSEICNDLLNVINSICLQVSANVSLKDSLKKQYENCKNKDFKKAMIEFSTSYELSELNIDYAIYVLRNKFDLLELDMFCNALSEYNRSGNIIDILDNLSDSLSNKQLEKMKQTTRSKVIYITFGVVLALTNIILLTFYPLFISVGQGFNNIFR